MVSTDGKLLGSDEVIKMGLSDDKVFYNILGDVVGITLRLDVYGNLAGLFRLVH